MHTLARQLERSVMLIGGAGLILMMLQVSIDVAGKFLLNAPVPLTMEMVSYYYMPAIVFLPLLILERKNSSLVHVELLYDRLPKRARTTLLPLTLLLSALYCASASWAAWQAAIVAMHRGTYAGSTIVVPVWPTRFLPAIGFALIVVALINKAFSVIFRGIDPVEGDGESVEAQAEVL